VAEKSRLNAAPDQVMVEWFLSFIEEAPTNSIAAPSPQ
jgi:hypothetical protein